MSENNRDRVEEGRLRMMLVGSVFGSWLGVFIAPVSRIAEPYFRYSFYTLIEIRLLDIHCQLRDTFVVSF